MRFVSQGKSTVSSDDLLPVLIFLVVKSGLASWYSQLTFMKQFRYSASSTQEADEAGFLVTSLEAAVEHVKSGSLKIGCGQKEGKLVNGKDNHEKSNKSNGIDDSTELFEHVKKGNLTEVQKILSEKVESEYLLSIYFQCLMERFFKINFKFQPTQKMLSCVTPCACARLANEACRKHS